MSICPDNMDDSQPTDSKRVAQAVAPAAVTVDCPPSSTEQDFSLQDTAAEEAPPQSLANLLDSPEVASATDIYTGAAEPEDQPATTVDLPSRGEVFELPGAESSANTADRLKFGVEPAAPATLLEEQGQSGQQAQDSTSATQPELKGDDSIEQAFTRHRQLLERNQHLQHALSMVGPLSHLL